MTGKQLGPIICKVCGGAHSGTLCTKFNSVRVLPAQAQPKPLALPPPSKPKGDKMTTTKPAKAKKAKKAKSAKSKTSPKRKEYLAAAARERRAATKLGMDLKQYRAHLAAAGK